MMGNNLKGVGMTVGMGMVICGLLLVILTITQPSLLLQGEEWTLVNILDDGDGLWMNENGDSKVDSAEGYEIGGTYESEVENNVSFIIAVIFTGVMFTIIGLMFFVGHSRIE